MIPELLTPQEGGKQTLKQKINEIIAHLIGEDKTPVEPKKDVSTDTAPIDAPVEPFECDGFTESGVTGFLNAPQGGFIDESGSPLVGMVKLDRVPSTVREAYRVWKHVDL